MNFKRAIVFSFLTKKIHWDYEKRFLGSIGIVMKEKVEASGYIHGSSSEKESARLYKQAERAEKFLWNNIDLAKHLHDKTKPFLEVGCGVGAQTLHLLKRMPQCINLIGIDIDEGQIIRAENHLSKFNEFNGRYSFSVADISATSLKKHSLSGAYICWVLEHLKYSDALTLLISLKKAVEPGGIIIINEIIMQPEEGVIIKTAESLFPLETKKAFLELLDVQQSQGGNPNMGTHENLAKLLEEAGISSYKYEKQCMSYISPQDIKESRQGTLQIIESAAPYLSDSRFNLREIEQELSGASEFHYSFGQCTIEI